MSSSAQTGVRLDPRIRRGLRAVGGGIRLRLLARGLAWLVPVLAAAAAVSFLVDYGLYRLTLQHLSVSQRALINGACLAVVLLSAWRRLLRPLTRRFSVRDLALVIEKAHPELQDRLLSALQFADPRKRPDGNVSAELMDAVVEEANRAARTERFRSVLRGRAVRGAARRALLCAAAVAALAAWRRDLARPWLERTLWLSEARYPKRTALTVEGGNPLRVVRGGELSVTVRADPDLVVPEAVTCHMRFPSLGDLVETIKPAAGEPERFTKVFPSVTEPFSFYVTGNDDRTDPIRVELVEPPALADARFVIAPPSYTLLAPVEVHATEGTLNVPEGSRLQLRGRATKDLAAAALFLDEEPAGSCRPVPAGDGAAPRGLEGELRIPVAKPFRGRRNLRIALSDTQGFENRSAAAFHVVVAADTPPTVQLEEMGMGGQVSSRARIPLRVTVRDDYGIEEVQSEWALESMPARVVTNDLKLFTPPVPEPPPLRGVFDLQAIRAGADGSTPPLEVGETVAIQVAARDSLPANVGTNRVLSNRLTFRIVPDDQVLAALVDAQRVMRERLRRIVELQLEIRGRTQTAIEQCERETTRDLARHAVASCADSEQQVRDQLDATTDRLEELLARIRNNRIVAETDERRMQRSIIASLRNAQSEYVAYLASAFEEAKTLAEAGDLARRLQELLALQDSLIKVLESVMAEMIKMENAQQVSRGLRTLIKLGDRVRGIIRDGGAGTSPPQGEE